MKTKLRLSCEFEKIDANTIKLENFLLRETYEQQEERVRKASPYGHLKTWKLARIIIKSGDDLRQE